LFQAFLESLSSCARLEALLDPQRRGLGARQPALRARTFSREFAVRASFVYGFRKVMFFRVEA
jgi:hypothetical protein